MFQIPCAVQRSSSYEANDLTFFLLLTSSEIVHAVFFSNIGEKTTADQGRG